MPWIIPDDVAAVLGIDPTDPQDQQWLVDATDASIAFCQRRRRSSGYFDDIDVVPSADVKTGTVLYAVALYRERGSVESFASFDGFSAPPVPTGGMGQVLRLLGVHKPAVA